MTELSVSDEIKAFDRERVGAVTPENLAKSIAIESVELLECFQWDAKADADRVQLDARQR